MLDSQKREDFVREADEVATWITDKVAIASSEEAGKDLEHVELLQKKFKEFMKVCCSTCLYFRSLFVSFRIFKAMRGVLKVLNN